METQTDTATTVSATVDLWRAVAATVETCAGDIDRAQLAYAVMVLAGETTGDGGTWYTLTTYATDSYRLARIAFPYNPHAEPVTPGTFAVEARAFAKAIAAITKAAGGAKKGAGALVTVTADGSGSVTVTGAGVTVTLTVAESVAMDPVRVAGIYGGMFADADANPQDTTPATFAPDTFGTLAAVGNAVRANYWRVVGWGKGSNPARVPVLYRAGWNEGRGAVAADILAMPVMVKN